MKSTLVLGSFVAALALISTSASGQAYQQNTVGPVPTPQTGYQGFGYGGFGRSFSSSYEEGVLYGLAELRRGTGDYNLATSQARLIAQEAAAKALENRQTAIANYFAARKINQDARAAERAARLTPAQQAELARQLGPSRLTAAEYVPAIGILRWPAALQGEEFAHERALVNGIFATRAADDTGIGSKFHQDVKQASDRLAAKLKQQMNELSPMEYIAARKFVTGLVQEAQFSPLAAGLASAE